MVTFRNIGGEKEIGSNCYLLEIDGVRIILDSGMHPKKEGEAAIPDFYQLKSGEVEAVFISHSHLDHIGTLPVLQMKQPQAEVFMTPATAAVGEVMLHNSVNVMSSKRLELGIIEYPLFTHRDLEEWSEHWQAKPYQEAFRIGPEKNVLAMFYDAGHILGSAGVYLESEAGETVFYTGDVQFEDQSVIPGADFPQDGVDTLIMECTRGQQERPEGFSRNQELSRFAGKIAETLQRGGSVLIPVFALGKGQEILYSIHRFKQEGLIPLKTPVYYGGLSAKVMRLYDLFEHRTRRIPTDFIFKEQVEMVSLPRRSKGMMRCEPGNIYLVSSGMMTEKTLSNTLAEQVLPNPANSILFVGYCDPDSPAGMLKTIATGQTVCMSSHGSPVSVKCEMDSFDFSGHSDREVLVDYVRNLHPKRVVLVHGDLEAIEWMRNRLSQELPDITIIIPEFGKTCILSGKGEQFASS